MEHFGNVWKCLYKYFYISIDIHLKLSEVKICQVIYIKNVYVYTYLYSINKILTFKIYACVINVIIILLKYLNSKFKYKKRLNSNINICLNWVFLIVFDDEKREYLIPYRMKNLSLFFVKKNWIYFIVRKVCMIRMQQGLYYTLIINNFNNNKLWIKESFGSPCLRSIYIPYTD